MRQIRLSIIGFGTAGRWLAGAIDRRRLWLEAECGVAVSVVSVATRRDGFVHREAGFDIPSLLELASAGHSPANYPGARRWETALEGLMMTESDVLAEASNTNPREPQPALSHIPIPPAPPEPAPATQPGAEVPGRSEDAPAPIPIPEPAPAPAPTFEQPQPAFQLPAWLRPRPGQGNQGGKLDNR